jgi:hypothetical protein
MAYRAGLFDCLGAPNVLLPSQVGLGQFLDCRGNEGLGGCSPNLLAQRVALALGFKCRRSRTHPLEPLCVPSRRCWTMPLGLRNASLKKMKRPTWREPVGKFIAWSLRRYRKAVKNNMLKLSVRLSCRRGNWLQYCRVKNMLLD